MAEGRRTRTKARVDAGGSPRQGTGMARRKGKAERGRSGILGLAATVVAVWLLWRTPLVWPLEILVVLFHELSHAIVAVLTGGRILAISLSPDQGGSTQTTGGWPILILNAGYVGSVAWGVLLMWLARAEKRAQVAVYALSALLLAATIGYVRPLLSFGVAFCLAGAGAMASVARHAPARWTARLLSGLGVFSVLYALVDVRDDVFLAPAGTASDATLLAGATGVPGVVWGVGWILAGVGVLVVFRRWWMGDGGRS